MVAYEIGGDSSKGEAALLRMQARVQELEAKLRTMTSTGKRGGDSLADSFGNRAVQSLTQLASGFLSVTAAMQAVNTAHQVFVANMRETSDIAQTSARNLVTLATIQEGGRKAHAVRAAAAMAASFGVTNQARAFDVVQTLQSAAGGNLEKGMAAAASVFRASQVGMKLETAQELATQGIVQGQDPEEFIRKAHVTGKISLRSPEVIAEAARGMQFFPDKDVGFAATGVLAGAFREETETYVKAAGIAMSAQASDEFKKSLEHLGLLGKDPMAILRGLHIEGVDTTDELAKLGLNEIRQVHAMNTLLNNMPAVEQYLSEIPRLAADTQLLTKERAGIEAELPTARIGREIAMLEAGQTNAQTLGPMAERHMGSDLDLLVEGTALRRMGLEQGPLGGDLIDERGRATTGWWAWANQAAAHLRGPSTMLPAARGETRPSDEFQSMMQTVRKELSAAASDLKDAARSMKGGPALVPATTDR